jgi:cysteine dioxygenase
MQDVIEKINRELHIKGLEDIDVKILLSIMEEYKSDECDWSKYALFDQSKYTRNLVDAGNGHYNLIVLCWGPGQSSPIHDHANSHCIFKILDGELTETKYGFPGSGDAAKQMEIVGESTFRRDEVNYTSNKIGLHKVSNNSNAPAVSLHLYSPPILECKTFCLDSGEERASGRICFYSKYGRKCSLSTSSQCLPTPNTRKRSLTASSQYLPIPNSVPNSIRQSRTGYSISNSVGTAESLYSFKMGSVESINRKYSATESINRKQSVSNNDTSSRKRSIDTFSEVPKNVVEENASISVTKPKNPPTKIRSIFWG